MIRIKTDSAIDALKRLGADLSEKQLAIAQSRAINRSLEKGRTIARKEIKAVYNISQKNLTGINYKRANPNILTGNLFALRKPIPLDAFAPKQETSGGSISITKKGKQNIKTFKKPKKDPTAGVSIEIQKGKREIIPYAFMIAGGAVRVFARGEYKSGTEHGFVLRHERITNEGSDTPIKPLITISEYGSILNPRVLSQIGRQVQAFYPGRLVHELEYLIDQAAANAVP